MPVQAGLWPSRLQVVASGSGDAQTARSERDQVEAALLVAVGRGDRDGALPELYRLYARRLFGLGMRVLGEAGLAEELVQETFIRVWRRADSFDEARGTAATFILTIARRIAIDLWRRPSSRPINEMGDDPAEVDETIDRVLLQLAVRDALDSLPPTHREVLDLSYRSDLTQAEVASRLGIPVGTVKSRTYHALRAFRRAVDQRGIDG